MNDRCSRAMSRANGYGRHTSAPLRLLLALLVLAPLAGCAGYGQPKYSQWSNADHTRYIDLLPFHADHPIARDIRFTHTQIVYFDSREYSRYITADERTSEIAREKYQIPTLHFLDPGSPVSASTQYVYHQTKAAAASEKGDRAMALLHRDLAMFTKNAEIESARNTTRANLVGALSGADSKTNRVEHQVDRGAALRASWIAEGTGAIGPTAPERSTLHIDSYWKLSGRKFQAESSTDFVVVAVYDDGHGRVIRSLASYPVINQLEDVDAPDIAGGAVFVPEEVIPSAKEKLIPSYLLENASFLHLVVLANAAVADIYAELERIVPEVQ